MRPCLCQDAFAPLPSARHRARHIVLVTLSRVGRVSLRRNRPGQTFHLPEQPAKKRPYCEPVSATPANRIVDCGFLLPIVLAPPIAQEVLVSPLAHLDHRRAALSDEPRKKIERDADIVGNRFVLQFDKKRQEVQRLLGTDFRLVVVRPIPLCELACVIEFVELYRNSCNRP